MYGDSYRDPDCTACYADRCAPDCRPCPVCGLQMDAGKARRESLHQCECERVECSCCGEPGMIAGHCTEGCDELDPVARADKAAMLAEEDAERANAALYGLADRLAGFVTGAKAREGA